MAEELTDNNRGNEKDIKIEEENEVDKTNNIVETAESAHSDNDVGSYAGSKSSPLLYGEEYEGEYEYYLPPPFSDLEVKESMEEMEKTEQVESPKTDVVSEGSDKGEKEKEDEEAKESPGLTPVRSEDLDQISTESIFESYFLQPKEKTTSEIKFEAEHRDIIEEEMKKLLYRKAIKEEVVPEKRKPLEKAKMALADVDTSGLYPLPKAIESEVSFAFDEEDEIGRTVARVQEIDVDIVKTTMDSLRELFKSEPDSTFDKTENILEEIVMNLKKGILTPVTKIINDSLPELKPHFKSALLRILGMKLSKYDKTVEVEEEKAQEGIKIVKKEQLKLTEAREVPEQEGIAVVKFEKPQKMEKLVEKLKTQKPPEEKTGLLAAEEFKKIISRDEKEVKIEYSEPEAYKKIDWELLLTESEKMIAADPRLRHEMEKFIERRKQELEIERHAQKETIAREERYKSTDPQIMLENINLNVTMKFILNSGEIFTCAYRYFMTFKEIKEDLAGIFRVPPDVLIIYRNDNEVKDEDRAHNLQPKIEPFDCVTFRLLTLDNDRWRLRSSHLELPVPDIITCTVESGYDHKGMPEYKEVVVEIEQRKIKKPFVGGYRDICTGIEYHHAFSQSAPREPSMPFEKRVSTDTQTTEFRSKCVDTDCDKSTQMSRSDYYISTESDKIVTPKPYVDYETWIKEKDMENKIILIQRYVRAMIIRKFVKKMAQEYKARKIWEEEQVRKRAVQKEIRVKQDIINMVYPKTRADFEALYAMVERWRKAQIERIGKLKTEAPRKAELCAVLEKEIKLLEAIEVHRIAVAKEQKKKKELEFLAKVSKPVTWTGYRGMTITMDTLKTQRARELRELYLSLSRDDLNYQDRIELLISLKYALRVNCTRITEELTNLINRECEMLIRGVSSKKLEYLRQRIDHLFLKYFKEPEFNPEMAKYDPDYNREPLKQNVMFCKMCHQMKMYKDFCVNARDTTCNVCRSCKTTFNIAMPRIDLNPYRYILKCVRRDEQKKNCYSSCAFILQEEDMRFLVDNIWHSRSAISQDDNLMDLRMPRWDKNKDWTPWNCILLTESEAKAHLRTDPAVNYEKQLTGEVISKHQLAKRLFKQMFTAEERIRDCGKWANVVDVKDYQAPPITADIWDLTPSECAHLTKNGSLYDVHETRRKDDNYVKYI